MMQRIDMLLHNHLAYRACQHPASKVVYQLQMLDFELVHSTQYGSQAPAAMCPRTDYCNQFCGSALDPE